MFSISISIEKIIIKTKKSILYLHKFEVYILLPTDAITFVTGAVISQETVARDFPKAFAPKTVQKLNTPLLKEIFLH